MISIKQGVKVRHSAYGPGTVKEVLGETALVDFFGESIATPSNELLIMEIEPSLLTKPVNSPDKIRFRRAYEAINLGIVPPHPQQLLSFSIQGEETVSQVRQWLAEAHEKGLCKVVFGDYGTGKTHFLRLVAAVAQQEGWVISFVEFDPKQADPAKPHLVYRAITSGLRFPERVDGGRSESFFGLIKEIRDFWSRVSIGPYFSTSPWFKRTLEIFRHFPHSDDQDYLDACEWLAGQPIYHSAVKQLARRTGTRRESPPIMPKSRETADIYVYHLVVIDEICRALGYKGLLLVLDEAEHVRGYNTKRSQRANNMFDLLARSAHKPVPGDSAPVANDYDFLLPKYWREGPHFGLVVGLTEGDTFSDGLPVREACAFMHSETDAIFLEPPPPELYKNWCLHFLQTFHTIYPEQTELISAENDRARLASLLMEEFRGQSSDTKTLRLWVKLATLVPSVVLARNASTIDELETIIRTAARGASGKYLPWES